jgi:hypothetical protein
MSEKRWQYRVMLVLGWWLVFSPFFFYGSLNDAAAWNSYLLGSAVVLLAVWTLPVLERWEERVNLVLGLWLIVAPFALGFYHAEVAAAWNQIILGMLIGADAIWALARLPTTSHACDLPPSWPASRR